MSNFAEKKKEINFVEAALWGAITFGRTFSKEKITNFDIIREFKTYLNIDDEYMGDDVAHVTFYRVNKNYKSVMNGSNVKFEMTKEEKIELAMQLLNEAKGEYGKV
jgi:hypothetical protein